MAVTISTSSWLRVMLAPLSVCQSGWVGTEPRGTEHPVLHLSSLTASPGEPGIGPCPIPQELCLFALWLIINAEVDVHQGWA